MTPHHYVKTKLPAKKAFLLNEVPKFLLFMTMLVAVIYTVTLVFWFQVSNMYLFILLVIGQVFSLWMALTFLYTIWDMNYKPWGDDTFSEPVDVFITVAGEPVEIVEETVIAALAMDYPNFNIYLLNDGYVRQKDNWQDIERLAIQYGIGCITRKIPGGAKAGNINNGLSLTTSPFVAIFDADHVPHPDFLRKTMRHFADPKMGFVQSPQYYKNYKTNYITRGAWDQQSLFFGAIKKGKNRLNSVTMCGTNMTIRRKPLEDVGGMCATNIAEDFVTGLFIHQRGWKSAYVPEVLAEGLAPEDFLSYYKQQLRWARGSLEVLFKYNPLFMRGLSWAQRIQYLASASYYLSGTVIFLNSIIPLFFFFTGAVPFVISTMALAIVFLPYIFLILYNLQLSTNFTYTFRALAFSMGSWFIHLTALKELVLNRKTGFAITSKKAVQGNFVYLVIPHLIYIALTCIGIGFALVREGMTASFATNASWVLLNAAIFYPFIKAALPQPEAQAEPAEIMTPYGIPEHTLQ
ncbi:glycosyltransferase [Candidatus Parcubacteria bacterium]|nr:glycosyltransferase [Candidatus Parcubacteria bacterium]